MSVYIPEREYVSIHPKRRTATEVTLYLFRTDSGELSFSFLLIVPPLIVSLINPAALSVEW